MKSFGSSAHGIPEYVERTFALEDEVLQGLREAARNAGLPAIQVSPFDARHLEVLTRAVNAKRAVEIGTLGGYSGASIARGLANGGMLYTIEYDAHHADVAEAGFKKYGLDAKIKLLRGRALDVLPSLVKEGPFDLVFIDADKPSYPQYLAWAEENLRAGGAVIADNAFAWGGVAKKELIDGADEDATAIHQFNERLARGGRFAATMLPTSEGLAFGVKIR